MISSNFYKKRNLSADLLGGKVAHYAVKDPSITIEWYNYTVKSHENLYTITANVFGKGKEHLWTYIADNNPPRSPFDWEMGDIVRLPKVIIKESDTLRTLYSNVQTTTTTV